MSSISSIPFSQLAVGMQAEYRRQITMQDIQLFAQLSGDYNPLHLDPEYAAKTIFGGCIAHGAFCALLISAAVANKLPGPGSIYLGQVMRFKKPVRPNDVLTTTLTVTEKKPRGNIVLIENIIKNQDGLTVFSGLSTVKAPTESLTLDTFHPSTL